MAIHKIRKRAELKLGFNHIYLLVLLLMSLAIIFQSFFNKPRWLYKRDELYAACVDCETAKQQAFKDIEKGQLCFIKFGMVTVENAHFFESFNDNYQVIAISGGCVGSDRFDCYNQIMVEKIKERFGQDVFKRVWKK